MSVPLSQMLTVARYVLSQKLRGESATRSCSCSSRCSAATWRARAAARSSTPPDAEEAAVASRSASRRRRVRRADGEHRRRRAAAASRDRRLVAGWSQRKRFIYLCTNALLLEEKLDEFEPDKHLSFSVHMDGPRAEHDESVCREGVYDAAVAAIREALRRGFRVTTNTTLFEGAIPLRMRAVLRRDDGARRRGDDGLARLLVREGARPGALPAARAHAAAVLARSSAQPKKRGASTSRRCSSSS